MVMLSDTKHKQRPLLLLQKKATGDHPP